MGFFAWQRFAWQNISWWFSVLDVPVTRWGGFSSSVCTACTDERDWSPVQFGSQWHRRLFTESYCMYYSTIASHNYYTMIKCRLRNLPISHLRDSAKTWLKHGEYISETSAGDVTAPIWSLNRMICCLITRRISPKTWKVRKNIVGMKRLLGTVLANTVLEYKVHEMAK